MVLASGGPDETLPVLTAASHLRRRGHDVRLGLPASALRTAVAGGHDAVAVEGFPAPTGRDVEAVRELCLGAELVVGTLSTEDVAATMAAFAGVPYAGLHLAPRPRRRGRQGEHLEALRDLLQLPRAVRPPGLAAGRAGALEVRAWDALLTPGVTGTIGFLAADPEPHGAVLVHDGGGLATAAALRAGVPSVVAAEHDRHSWGRALERAGVGVVVRQQRRSGSAALDRARALALGPGTVATARALAGWVTPPETAAARLVELLEQRVDYRASQFA